MKTMFICVLFIFIFHGCGAWPHNVVHMSQESTEVKDFSHGVDQNPVNVQPQRSFSFASYYGDHMVLQRAPQRATVWGFHPDPGSRVILQVKGRKVYNAVVDESGIWKVLLEAESSAGPFTIVALTETQTISLNDVLFGDVWICSGQSNMAFTLNMAFNGSEEMIEAKSFQDIRVFTAAQINTSEPLDDLAFVAEKWSLPSNKTLGYTWVYFSAICWLFGKSLYQQLGYPIGLIDTTWGGTPIEYWMSADALKTCGDSPDSRAAFDLDDIELVHTRTGKEVEVEKDGPDSVAVELGLGQLWNAMVHPFLPLTIYGVIWDQGESDAFPLSFRNNYNCTFPTMIDDWRSKFSQVSGGQTKPDFPFGFVQIGSRFKDAVITSGYPVIRWHQTADYGYVPNTRMRNVFMSVTMDIADYTSPYSPVHTRDKEDIAHRLFLGGLDIAYNISTLWKGPLPVSITQSSDNLVLYYGTTWTLEIRQNEGFEMCCSRNGSQHCQSPEGATWWVPTPITNYNATHIEIYSGVCGTTENILGLRYAWRLSPCDFKMCAVYSKENSLPAPIFVKYFSGLDLHKNSLFHFDWSKPVHIQ